LINIARVGNCENKPVTDHNLENLLDADGYVALAADIASVEGME